MNGSVWMKHKLASLRVIGNYFEAVGRQVKNYYYYYYYYMDDAKAESVNSLSSDQWFRYMHYGARHDNWKDDEDDVKMMVQDK